jgi:hypothetical protein
MKIRPVFTVGTALAALLMAGPVRAQVVVDGSGSFVTLFGVNATPAGVVFDAREPAALCGATYHVERFGGDPALVALIRDGGHRCRGKITTRVTVAFNYEQIGLEVGDLFQVLNPIEANRLSPQGEPISSTPAHPLQSSGRFPNRPPR